MKVWELLIVGFMDCSIGVASCDSSLRHFFNFAIVDCDRLVFVDRVSVIRLRASASWSSSGCDHGIGGLGAVYFV